MGCSSAKRTLKAGSGDSTRYIPLHSLTSHAGSDLCKVLPALHTLTACDYTSKVGTKPASLKAKPISYLKDFGSSRNGPSEDEITRVESYLVQVYKNGTTCSTMNELRDYIYHHSKGISLEQLPPTSHALKAHILRAYYGTYVMTTILSEEKVVLDPLAYGYVAENELLLPDMSVQPVPEEYAVQCNCSKCVTVKCPCRKGNLPCCQFCKCQVLRDENANCCRNPAGSI